MLERIKGRYMRGVVVFVIGLAPVILLSRKGANHFSRFGGSLTDVQITQFGGALASILGGFVAGVWRSLSYIS